MRSKVHRPGIRGFLLVLLALSLFAAPSSAPAACDFVMENFDNLTPPALPSGWVASQGVNLTGAPPWVTSNVGSHTWPNAAFSTAPDNILDNRLDTPLIPTSPINYGITFQSSYNLESAHDGAVLEISSPNINGGAFTDITDPAVNGGFTSGGYNTLITSPSSPIAGRMAWSGNSGGYVFTRVIFGNAVFPDFHSVKVRFRLVSDNSGASEGWRIDTVYKIHNECPSPAPSPPPCPLHPWTAAASYPLPEISENAMGSNSFDVYSAGGYTSSGETNAAYHYDRDTNTWTALAPLPVALARARGAYSFDPNQGGFFVFGGVNQSTVLDTTFFYDVALHTWSARAPMPAPRYLPNVVYCGGKIFVIGGHDGTSETNQTWEYDPEADTWNTGRADIPVAMAGSATGVVEHFIYLVSHLNGGAGSNLHYRYDVLLNNWTPLPPAPATLYQPVGATLGRQNAVVGGPNHANAPSGPHTGSYLYNTDQNVWSTGPNTSIGHASAGGASIAVGNRLLVVGGHNYASGNTNVVETAITSCAAPPSPSPTVTPPPTPTPTATIFPTATPTPTDCPPFGCATPSVTPATPTPPPTPSPTTTPSPTPAQALNISTRLRVEIGDNVMIGGFIVTGSTPKKVALRGLGPSLGNSGLSDVLADPTLELRGSTGASLMQNNDWQDDPAQAAELNALGLALEDPNESGIVVTLPPGAYTAILAGNNQTTGIGLVEIYDADPGASSQLANISTRGFVRTGDNVMIGGFILGQGDANVAVAVRGLGPSLSESGLSNVLADPTLELRDSNGALLVANDDWQDDPVSAAQLTAYGLAPQDSLESGIVASLPPGAFTAILAGKEGGIGLGLVEIYSDVEGATFIVTSTADSGAGSLRDAIAAAGNGDMIQFAPALNGETIALTSDELVIDKNITISGPGPNQLTVRRSTTTGTPAFRIFHVTPGHFVTMEGLTITSGFTEESGVGIFNDGATLTLNNCAVANNFGGFLGGVSGGGIYNSGVGATLTIVNSTIAGNILPVGNQFNGSGNGAGIYNNGTLVIDSSTVTGNHFYVFSQPGPMFGGDGGGIYSVGGTVTISNSTISSNRANRSDGGIFNGGTLEITNSTLSGNRSLYSGGAIGNTGTVTISHSTLSGNSAYYKWFGVGGGIANGGTLEIHNSTLSGNRVDGGGGAVSNSGGATTITSSTLTDNFSIHTEAVGGGGLRNVDGGTLQIGNTIIHSGSSDANFNNTATVISQGYNLCSDNGSGFLTGPGDQMDTEPMLGPLQNNGGPTFTHALLAGSPALDAGDPNFVPSPLFDQRGPGYNRVVNGRIDIGAFELQP